jgi:16S rRNA (guanine527-N7)-methyltransferase
VSSIDAVIATLGLSISVDTRERLDAYVALLMEANSQFNLTAIRDIERVESLLVAGSLEVVRYIPMRARSLIDVGSGGGVPGMIVAIARPDLKVHLLDATAKKVKFLSDTASVLGLSNVTVTHGRAEDLAHDSIYRERFDVGTARAVARLATLVELVLPFVAPGGVSLFPKGPTAPDEIDEARQAVGYVGGRNIRAVESRLDDSFFVLIDKAKPTPDRFPRRVGIPGKRPIGVPSG